MEQIMTICRNNSLDQLEEILALTERIISVSITPQVERQRFSNQEKSHLHAEQNFSSPKINYYFRRNTFFFTKWTKK